MMCDQEERPGTISQNEDQEKAREDIEEMLDMIYKETPTSGSCVKKCPEVSVESSVFGSNEENPLIFPGRYVTKVVCVFPLEVSKRFVRPHLTSEGNVEPSAEFIVHKLFGIQKLGNLLLLITPTAIASRRDEKYIMHCYAVDTQWHLGVTSLIGRERDLIKNEQNPEKYSVIFCSSYIELEDAFMPTSIKGQLFDVLRKRSLNATTIWYKGNKMTLQYWSSDPEQYQIEKIPQPAGVASRLTLGRRSIAGSDRVSGTREGVTVTRSKRKLNEIKQRKRDAFTPHHICPAPPLCRQKHEPRISDVPKVRRPAIKGNVQDVRSRIIKKSVNSTSQRNRSLSQQQRHQFTHTPIQTRGQRKPKSSEKERNSRMATTNLPQPTPHHSSFRHIAVPSKGKILGSSNKSDTLLRREREWVKFVGSGPKRRHLPIRRKEKFWTINDE